MDDSNNLKLLEIKRQDAAVTAWLLELETKLSALPSVQIDLETRKELLELRERELEVEREGVKLSKQKEPWWRTAAGASTVAAIVGATVSLTTVIITIAQKDRELAQTRSQQAREASEKMLEIELAKEKQEHDEAREEQKLAHTIALDFLDRTKDPSQRISTLRLVKATTKDKDLISWVEQETAPLESQLRVELDERRATERKLRAQISATGEQGAAIAALRAKLTEEQAQVSRLTSTLSPVNAGAASIASDATAGTPSGAQAPLRCTDAHLTNTTRRNLIAAGIDVAFSEKLCGMSTPNSTAHVGKSGYVDFDALTITNGVAIWCGCQLSPAR